MSAPGDIILIPSDTEEDELYMPLEGEYILPKRSTPDEIVPDSEGEPETFPTAPRTPPRPRLREPRQQASDTRSIPSSPTHKRKKLKLDDNAQEKPKVKRMKTAKKAVVTSEDENNQPSSNKEEPQLSSSSQPRSVPSKPRPRPKLKAKTKMQTEGSETMLSVPVESPHIPAQTDLEPSVQPQTRQDPPKPSPEHRPSRPDETEYPTAPTHNPKSKRKDKEIRQAKENPPSPPQDTPQKTPPANSSRANRKNRPLTDILREFNKSGTLRISPAVSRSFLSRIAPLHSNRREPPPPPPRIIPKKTRKEIQMEERWEEELQDSIPNWCELTEEERTQYRRQKRDWELGLCED